AFVDQRVARQADDVEELALLVGDVQRIDRVLDPFADDVQSPFERSSIRGVRLQADVIGRRVRLQPDRIPPAPDKQLLEYRLDADGAWTDRTVVGRHIAPAKKLLTFFLDDPRNQILNRLAVVSSLRQEDQADAVLTGWRQRSGRNRAQERVRHLNEDA